MKKILTAILIIIFIIACIIIDIYADKEKHNISIEENEIIEQGYLENGEYYISGKVNKKPIKYVDLIFDIMSMIISCIIAPILFIIGIVKVLRKREGKKYIINSIILFSVSVIIQIFSGITNCF